MDPTPRRELKFTDLSGIDALFHPGLAQARTGPQIETSEVARGLPPHKRGQPTGNHVPAGHRIIAKQWRRTCLCLSQTHPGSPTGLAPLIRSHSISAISANRAGWETRNTVF